MVNEKHSKLIKRLKALPPIKVGWTEFSVELTKKDIFVDGELCWGECDFEKSSIRLNISTPASMLRQTFLHEMIHIVLETIGYGADTEKDGILPLKLNNEDLTESITKGLSILFNLNPELKELLFND